MNVPSGASAPTPVREALQTGPPIRPSHREPTVVEVLLLAVVAMLITAVVVEILGGYWARAQSFGDNSHYTSYSTLIRLGRFDALEVKGLMGVSYVTALLSSLTGLPDLVALLVVCGASAIAAVALAWRLWGGWTAGFFAVTSPEWVLHATFGGAETLGAALIFAAFAAMRKQRISLAGLFAALAATVRPEGILATLALGLALLYERRYRDLLVAVAIGTIVIGLYVTPLMVFLGDPLANYRGYERDFPELIIHLPFVAITRTLVHSPVPWTFKAQVLAWLLITTGGLVMMWRSARFRAHAGAHPIEPAFAILMAAFYYCYNSQWAFHEFARFTLPLLPLVYFVLLPWMPKDRRLLWGLSVAVGAFSGASTSNMRRTLSLLRRAFGA